MRGVSVLRLSNRQPSTVFIWAMSGPVETGVEKGGLSDVAEEEEEVVVVGGLFDVAEERGEVEGRDSNSFVMISSVG